jgi:BirA family biotin operon repressor/biotin-[acetyl-CoA-carboxylase] ligase
MDHLKMPLSLSAKKILSLKTYPQKIKITVLDTVDSTNNYLLNRAIEMNTGHICLADTQTQGRGQRGNQWSSPPKVNIYCSILWHFTTSENLLTGLSLLVGVAIINTLKHFNLADLGLKWPNDVWQASKKICGILLEYSKPANDIVIGIGLNVNAPEHRYSLDSNWTCMEYAMSRSFDRNQVAAVLLDEMLAMLNTFSPANLPVLLTEWAHLDVLYHKKIDFRLGEKRYYGVASGIDRYGRLIIDTDGSKQLFSSGEIRSIHTD